jgi:hypothetical protein
VSATAPARASKARARGVSTGALERARADLAERLRERFPEIEQAAMTRLRGVSAPPDSLGPAYIEGLGTAATAALEYLLEGIERGEGRLPQPPPAVLIQARLAARSGVSLDTVLRRCFAGYTLFGDFVMQEAAEGGLLQSAAMSRLSRAQASLFDRLVVAVTEEYTREAESRPGSAEEHRAELVARLLAGEPLDTPGLGYDLEAHHLGLIAQGEGAAEAIRGLASSLDRRLLAVRQGVDTAWAWLGGRHPTDPEALCRLVSQDWPFGISLTIGEPAEGLSGWRLTHRQAAAAMSIARRDTKTLTRYADVALLASVIQDDLLVTSLRQLYLAPLETERDGGEVLRETLRAYFAADRNVSSAAVALGVSRQTVINRLHGIEEKLGRQLRYCAAEFETALRMEKF